MKKHNAFGAIDMLFTLVIVSVVFIMVMPNLTGGGGGLYSPSVDTKSVKQAVKEMESDIMEKQQQSVNYHRQVIDNIEQGYDIDQSSMNSSSKQNKEKIDEIKKMREQASNYQKNLNY